MQASQEGLRVYIRWMIRRDMHEVLAIENDLFPHPWTEGDFIQCLRGRNCIGMVAEHGNDVVGYMIYELRKASLAVLNFAVDREHWGRGVGIQMVNKLIGKLSAQRRKFMTVEVWEHNLDAQLFFSRRGFKATRIVQRTDDKTDFDYEAYRFVYRVKA